MRKIIGLTGGVASGKSTVSRFFSKLGAKIINVDKIGHRLLKNQDVIDLIDDSFFGVVENNVVSRKKLGKIVFENSSQLDLLNEIMYPRMKEEVINSFVDGINIIDMAILFESGFDSLCNAVVVVCSDIETQISRMEKRAYSEAKITGILNSQMDPKEKTKRADFVIINNKSIVALKRKVTNLYNYLLENIS